MKMSSFNSDCLSNQSTKCTTSSLCSRCKESGCGGLVRPHVVWFGEPLFEDVLDKVHEELEKCDLCLVVSIKSSKKTSKMSPKEVTLNVPQKGQFKCPSKRAG